MDASIRESQRANDPAREALLELRVGGGIEGWLSSSACWETGAHPSERDLLKMLLDVVVPDPDDDEDSRMHWARGYGATRPVVVVRFAERIVVVSFTQAFFPSLITPWIENRASAQSTLSESVYHKYEVSACCPKRTVKDRFAREAYDDMVRSVQMWAAQLQYRRDMIATAFTLEQTRVYRGLDPLGK